MRGLNLLRYCDRESMAIISQTKIFSNEYCEYCCILIYLSIKFISKVPRKIMSIGSEIGYFHGTGDKPFPDPIMAIFPDYKMPRWVKTSPIWQSAGEYFISSVGFSDVYVPACGSVNQMPEEIKISNVFIKSRYSNDKPIAAYSNSKTYVIHQLNSRRTPANILLQSDARL